MPCGGLCQIRTLGTSRCPGLRLLEHNFPAQRQTIREHTDTQMVSKHTGRVHTQTNCTQAPLKRHLPAHSRSIHTQITIKLPSTKTQKDTDTQQSKTHKDALSGSTRAQAPVLIICLQQEGNALYGSRLEEYCIVRLLVFTVHLNNGVVGDYQE